MSRSSNLIERRRAILPAGVGQFAGDVTVASAKGARLTDADGREWIDLASGIGVTNAGHCPPPVVEAIKAQAEKLLHTCIHVATYEPYIALCEKLAALLPHGDDTRVMLVNTGAEAVENAVKIARQATGRPAILCFTDAFHGRTMMSMTLTSKTGYKRGCGPFAPEVYRLQYPNHYLYGDGLPLEAFVSREIDRLRQAFVNQVPAEHVAAVILEPILGEGGFVPAPLEYLRRLRDVCTEHGILLICDEVQSGFCRAGRWGAYEFAGIVPDLSTWAKALGGGLPIAAVIGRGEVMRATRPGTLGGTYGGNPVACVASLAAIRLMEEHRLGDRAMVIGARIIERFRSIKARCLHVGDVRGVGAMVALELSYDRDPRRPAADLCARVLERCRDQGVLILSAGAHGNILRILAPLVIEDVDLTRALDVIEAAVLEVCGEAGDAT